MDLFDHPRVLPLRQMTMTKLAITMCRDPEILNFMKTNGCASFDFPSKLTHLYLQVESPNEETWISRDCLTRRFQTRLHLIIKDTWLINMLIVQ
ncbi:hypothetical protein TNIN_493141 [Trichonephila inaurata madagascariensis]|uniref:Uncharacterized protein n=1 Tax=Trichonephila inaurata madagascariensis TaxID=2747483 RepID=A0A8X7CEM0_9ARAC|nr:hypothetical protein TNIN_493141 [Trichonephila inaurata madagascariensis]